MTPLQDTFSCNFNILVAGSPRVMGVREILSEWLAFRIECVKRKLFFQLSKDRDKLHLLKGLEKILLDIDKAIKIVRETEEEAEVVPNLMIGFGIDEIQAEYVAEIKLRHLNREYILKRLNDIEQLLAEIDDLESKLNSKSKIKSIIVDDIKNISKKYAKPRKTQIYYPTEQDADDSDEIEIPDYPVTLFFTRDGYFKKITPQSLRMSSEQKLKDGDEIIQTVEASNKNHLLFFSTAHQVYKSAAYEFDDSKASVMGDFVPSKLEFDAGEGIVYMAVTDDYSGYMIFVFENGKIAKVDMKSYETKTKRKKLVAAYSDKAPLCSAFYIKEDCEILLKSTNGRMLLVHTGAISPKTTKNTQGVAVMTQRKGQHVASAGIYKEGLLAKPHRYRTRSLPAAGSTPAAEEQGEQLTL
jgi:DNA gyrase subunit A